MTERVVRVSVRQSHDRFVRLGERTYLSLAGKPVPAGDADAHVLVGPEGREFIWRDAVLMGLVEDDAGPVCEAPAADPRMAAPAHLSDHIRKLVSPPPSPSTNPVPIAQSDADDDAGIPPKAETAEQVAQRVSGLQIEHEARRE